MREDELLRKITHGETFSTTEKEAATTVASSLFDRADFLTQSMRTVRDDLYCASMLGGDEGKRRYEGAEKRFIKIISILDALGFNINREYAESSHKKDDSPNMKTPLTRFQNSAFLLARIADFLCQCLELNTSRKYSEPSRKKDDSPNVKTLLSTSIEFGFRNATLLLLARGTDFLTFVKLVGPLEEKERLLSSLDGSPALTPGDLDSATPERQAAAAFQYNQLMNLVFCCVAGAATALGREYEKETLRIYTSIKEAVPITINGDGQEEYSREQVARVVAQYKSQQAQGQNSATTPNNSPRMFQGHGGHTTDEGSGQLYEPAQGIGF